MFIHPHCACTRASLAELESLLTESAGHARSVIVLVRPEGAPPDWSATPLAKQAGFLPGSTLVIDELGVESQPFGVRTSGHILFYDAQGNLRYSGGITPFRGQAGDSPGRRALVNLLHRQQVANDRQPVYGCPLLGSAECAPTKGSPCP